MDGEYVEVEEKGKNKRKKTVMFETKCNNYSLIINIIIIIAVIIIVNTLIKICTIDMDL